MKALPIAEVLTEMKGLGQLVRATCQPIEGALYLVRLQASGDRELAVEGIDLTQLVSMLLSSEIGRANEEQRPKDASALRTLQSQVLLRQVTL